MVATGKNMVMTAFLFLLAVQAHVTKHKVTPVEKVIELLTKLEAEVQAEGKKEAAAYDKFACFCKEQADDKLYAIEKSEKKIAMQEKQIKALASEISDLQLQIADLRKKIKKAKADQEEADKVRNEEFEKYSKKEKALSGAIKAIEGAIASLEQSKEGMVDAKLNLQQTLALPNVRMALALIQQEPAAYEYRSNDIIATLKGLLKTFKDNKEELDTEEAHKRNDYELAKQANENEIAFAQQTTDEKSKLSAEKEAEKEQIKKDKDEETADMNADQAFLDELTTLGEKKAEEFDQRSKTRTAEITALNEALTILKSGVQPNYGANKKLNLVIAKETLTQGAPVAKTAHGHWVWVEDPVESKPMAFLQVNKKASESKSKKVLSFLTEQAKVLKSAAISTLLAKIEVGAGLDHFVKVRGMIKDLIAKLEADAEAEATTKSFCDEEMKKSIEKRDAAIAGKEETSATIDQKKTEIADLVAEIDDLANQLAELRKGLFEAEQLREKERLENEETLAQAKEGKASIESAIKVLKEFYGEAFAQFVPAGAGRDGKTVSDLAPDTGFDGKYGGMQDAAKGIFGFLEIIQSDFERTIKTVEEAEEEAATAHEEYKTETEADIKAKEGTKKEKEDLKKTTEEELVEAEDKFKDFKKELKEAKDELADLKPICLGPEQSWEDRRKQQKQEIEALKQALAILEDWKGF